MKSLQHILESILDADFDITDKDLTLAQAGWYIEKAEASACMMTSCCNKFRISEVGGIKCDQISGESPWREFEKIGNENGIKCTCRNRWNNLKYVFACYLLAFMRSAHADEKSVVDTITDFLPTSTRSYHHPVATVKMRGSKLYIKAQWKAAPHPTSYGLDAKLSITLSQRAPENRARFYK